MTLEEKLTEIKSISNVSTTCLFPMVGFPWAWYGGHCVNLFMGDLNYPELNEHIFLLLKFSDSERYMKIEDALRKVINYLFDYEVDKEHTMFCFSVLPKHKEDYALLKAGKYSRLSPSLKEEILGRYPNRSNLEILTRSEERRKRLELKYDVEISPEAELFDPPKPEREIFGYVLKHKEDGL